MSLQSLLLRTLAYYWRTNLAVLLGVVVGTAVLGGALIVGDSVRGSLRQMTLVRLGRIDHVLQSPRFFREALADELAKLPEVQKYGTVAPAIVLPATAERRDTSSAKVFARAGRTTLYGVDQRTWSLNDAAKLPAPQAGEVVMSQRVAEALGAKPGDVITLIVEIPAAIPRDSLLGKKDERANEVQVTLKGILPESSGMNRLGLTPDQQLPANVFVALRTLQDALGLAEGRSKGEPPQPVLARCNALFVGSSAAEGAAGTHPDISPQAAEALTSALKKTWQLADLDARLAIQERKGAFALESRRMILEPALAKAGRDAAKSQGLIESPVLVSLANEITPDKSDKMNPDAVSRYSVVAGIDPVVFTSKAARPFGPFQYIGSRLDAPLGEGSLVNAEGGARADGIGEIAINDWLAEDLHVQAGDIVKLTWHEVGSHGELPEKVARFRVRGIIKLAGAADDKGYTPDVPGITDVDSFEDWDQPFPMKKVTRRDDQYWPRYRATPKAFVTLKTAQALWKSRYGDLTSLRLAPAKQPADEATLIAAAGKFERQLLDELSPADTGLAFRAVKFEGLAAAGGTTDFSMLFMGFSFFLILSALALISLLFRLGIERRASQLGLLLATGHAPSLVRRLLLSEAAVVVLLGSLVGILAAWGYAHLMVYGLKTWWYGAIQTRDLYVYVTPLSLVLGVALSAGIALFAVWWRLRDLAELPVRALLAGATQRAETSATVRRSGRLAAGLALGGLVVALALSAGVMTHVVPQQEAFEGISWPTVCFFIAGISALTSGLATFSWWIGSDTTAAVRGQGWRGLMTLAVRNAGRQRSRSVLTTGLIATATFLIVAIAAGHRNPAVELPDKSSGNGGFALVAESSAPILQNLNTPAGRAAFGLDEAEPKQVLAAVTDIEAFRVNPGENASCLNIYQTRQPTILGVPESMIRRGGFEFANAGEENPWTLLEQRKPEDPIPVLGDMNTLQYSLHKGVGTVFEIRDEQNQPVKIKVAGQFDGSVFQGVLLMHEIDFRRLFPSRSYQYFLIELTRDAASSTTTRQKVSDLLESKIAGFDAEPVADRLRSFLAVQNTYLSTFQTLGGLGLLLGTLGLAAVMLRNVLERRGELALLRAVGFRQGSLAWLVAVENALLLAWGLAVGTLSALIAMSPHLKTTGADFPAVSVTLLLTAVFVTGMLASLLAVFEALRTPVLQTLRGE